MQASGKVYILSFVPVVFIDYKAEWPTSLVVSWGRVEMINPLKPELNPIFYFWHY